MLILAKKPRLAVKPCCSGCKSGKPCCGTKTPPRIPAFKKKRGLWLPRRDLTLPKNLLQFPSEAEWGGLWRPWLPMLAQRIDMSCLPCCDSCVACDPGLDDAGYPMTFDDLNVTITGGITAVDVLSRASCGGASSAWSYENQFIGLDTSCGDPGWTTVGMCLYCDSSTGDITAIVTGGGADCALGAPFERVATSFTCDPSPFSATFSFETDEISVGGCTCGDGTPITITVTE